MGRITGSASIETLVRVGIEKENGLSPDSKMIVLHDFTPCVDDELDVKRGNVRSVSHDRLPTPEPAPPGAAESHSAHLGRLPFK